MKVKAGDKVQSSDGHPVTVVNVVREDGVDFAWITYDDGHLPFDIGGRVTGTEEAPIWEHRVKDGKVIPSGGNYWNPDDWVVERGLQVRGR